MFAVEKEFSYLSLMMTRASKMFAVQKFLNRITGKNETKNEKSNKQDIGNV